VHDTGKLAEVVRFLETMTSTPVFKAHLHVEVIPGEGVLLLSEQAGQGIAWRCL
jgi:hypothetical protein